MKIAYKHLVKNIIGNPSIEEISDHLFQLGHEHEIEKSPCGFCSSKENIKLH